MSSTGLKLLVSGGALAFIAGHLIWPALTVDAVTLGLIAIAVLPWVSSLIESVELPGGFKIKLQNLQAAASKVTGGVPATEGARPTASYLRLKEDDPNLALAGLRIEIETRLRALAQKYGVDVPRTSLMEVYRRLREDGVLNDASISGLQELITAGNHAAHGAKVEPQVASWAFDVGSEILAVLDGKLQK